MEQKKVSDPGNTRKKNTKNEHFAKQQSQHKVTTHQTARVCATCPSLLHRESYIIILITYVSPMINKAVKNSTTVEKKTEKISKLLDLFNREHLPWSPARGSFNEDLSIQ